MPPARHRPGARSARWMRCPTMITQTEGEKHRAGSTNRRRRHARCELSKKKWPEGVLTAKQAPDRPVTAPKWKMVTLPRVPKRLFVNQRHARIAHRSTPLLP